MPFVLELSESSNTKISHAEEVRPRKVARRKRLYSNLGRKTQPITSDESWRHWFRHDFLRSCFVGASLVWNGFGMLALRYALDPYRPGQGAAPIPVYVVVSLFLVASVAAQILLYRRWWPSDKHRTRGASGERKTSPVKVRWNPLRRSKRKS